LRALANGAVDPLAAFDYVPLERVRRAREIKGAVRRPRRVVHPSRRALALDAMLEDFQLSEPGSTRCSHRRGADTARLDLAPQAAGLLAVSLGLSRVYADDAAMLEAAMPVYDALYAWCRDAQGEPHSWNYPS
jgi:hypothetical protein